VATYISVTSDLAGSVLWIYQSSNTATNPGSVGFGLQALTNNTTSLYMAPIYDSTGTNIVSGATNGILTGKPIVIRHLKNDNYEVRFPSSIVASNLVTLGAAPTTAVQNGDMVYPMIAVAAIPVGSATVTLGPAQFIASQQPGCPFLVGVNYTTSGSINAMSGVYLQ
jgi:hypothetical protein